MTMMISFRYRGILALVAVTIGMVLFWMICKSGSAEKSAIVDDVPELIFSRESGFYEDEFDLEILSASGTVYYTTDGSDPTADSILYTGPIRISDASIKDNMYSLRTDLSTAFYEDLLKEAGYASEGYTVPDFPVDKCNVIRAVVCYDDGEYSRIKTASYFVGFDDRVGYDQMNVVSIVTDPKNLFDYKKGIYVTGWRLDHYLEEIRTSSLKVPEQAWWWWKANYQKRGISVEEPADLQFFDTDRNLVLSQKCGIRIHGGASRAYLPKSLNLYAREQYDGNNDFQYPFFGSSAKEVAGKGNYYLSRMTLFNGGNDYSKCKDWIVNTLCRDMDFATMDMKPCVMFLDGEYWGVYWLSEKYDEAYMNVHYGIERDNVVIIKSGMLECGIEEDLEAYNECMEFLKSKDMRIDANYRKATSILDMDNTINYYAVMLYLSRFGDWPGTNVALFRSRSPDTDRYSDCRYRWMLFDVNSLGMVADLDPIELAIGKDPLFANLMRNDEFRNKLLDRILELGNTVFSEENVSYCMEEFHGLMDVPMRVHCRRFYGESGYSGKYSKLVDWVEQFFHQRHQYIEGIIDKYRQY